MTVDIRKTVRQLFIIFCSALQDKLFISSLSKSEEKETVVCSGEKDKCRERRGFS